MERGANGALVALALKAGFRGIDTANQRRHYFEAGVGRGRASGEGCRASDSSCRRSSRTVKARIIVCRTTRKRRSDAQVRQSFASSLEHLGIDHVDSYVLHGPAVRHGLGPREVGAWRAMEALHREGKVRLLGVSNVSLEQLAALCDLAASRPLFVQNRCYASTAGTARSAPSAPTGIIYQGFSLLTANARELGRPAFRNIVERTGQTPRSSGVPFRTAGRHAPCSRAPAARSTCYRYSGRRTLRS